MIKVCVADISALVEPSTTASATTEFAGFLDSAALGAALGAYRGCTCHDCFFVSRRVFFFAICVHNYIKQSEKQTGGAH